MTVRRMQTAMTLPKGKRAPELKKRQLGTAQRPPTSGNACRNLRVQRRRIPAAQDSSTGIRFYIAVKEECDYYGVADQVF